MTKIDRNCIHFQCDFASRSHLLSIDFHLNGRQTIQSAVERGQSIVAFDLPALAFIEQNGVGARNLYDFYSRSEVRTTFFLETNARSGVAIHDGVQHHLLTDEHFGGIDHGVDRVLLSGCRSSE